MKMTGHRSATTVSGYRRGVDVAGISSALSAAARSASSKIFTPSQEKDFQDWVDKNSSTLDCDFSEESDDQAFDIPVTQLLKPEFCSTSCNTDFFKFFLFFL